MDLFEIPLDLTLKTNEVLCEMRMEHKEEFITSLRESSGIVRITIIFYHLNC